MLGIKQIHINRETKCLYIPAVTRYTEMKGVTQQFVYQLAVWHKLQQGLPTKEVDMKYSVHFRTAPHSHLHSINYVYFSIFTLFLIFAFVYHVLPNLCSTVTVHNQLTVNNGLTFRSHTNSHSQERRVRGK
jgi:hypothetical protein